MMRAALLSVAGLAAAVFMASAPASAAEYGTAAEAKALLERAVVEVKTDKAAALVKFNDPKGAFRDRDLYVFCANAGDGVTTAHPKFIGTDIRTIKDKTGKPFGQEMFDNRQRGEDQRGHLHVAASGRHRAGAEGVLHHQGRRRDLRRRLLQIEQMVWGRRQRLLPWFLSLPASRA